MSRSHNNNKTPGRKTTPKTIQDPIEVFCRIRPLAGDEESCVDILSENVLQFNAPKNLKSQSRVEQIQCTFSRIFGELVTQKEVFEQTGLPLVNDLIMGKNALCFMYGITGSGKTFTMNGEPTNGGMLPRCLDTIFNSINHLQTPRCLFKSDGYNGYQIVSEEVAGIEADERYADFEALHRNMDIYDTPRLPDTTILQVDEDNNYAVFVSFVEIYNNSVFDLLEDISLGKSSMPKPPGSKILREDQKSSMFVYDVTEMEIKNTEEAFTLFMMGQQRRKTAHTLLNTESSRSHCVFTIKLIQVPLGPNGDTVMTDPTFMRISQLSLCDLAGSERAKRTNAEGEQVRQAGHINNSLMTLRACIETLRLNQRNQDGGNKIVPYRDSKLTHLFKNYFDGDGKVRMVVCLNPRSEDFDESLHVMRFSEMTQEVKVARSEGVRFDLGLAAGRGKANKHFRAMKGEDTASSDTQSQEDMLPPLQQFSPWPLCQLSGHQDEDTLRSLMNYLEERIKLRETLHSDWTQKQTEVRNMICQLEQDNIDLTKSLDDQRSLLSDKEKEAKAYEKRIRSMNEKYESIQRSSQTFETQKRQLNAEVEKYKEMVHRERQEKLKIKQTLKELTSNERLRWERECTKRVHDKEMEMEGQVLRKNEKLRQLRDVIENLQLPQENQVRLNQIITGGKARDNVRASCVNTNQLRSTETCLEGHKKSRHTKEFVMHTPDPKRTSDKTRKTPSTVQPKTKSRITLTGDNTPRRTLTGDTPRSRPKIRSRSPPATSRKASNMAPVRGSHRRSRSSDFWLDHKPRDTLETDNIMRPLIKNKKTVKTPTVKDIKVIPNYILTHQEEDSAGEIETKLVKGEVLATRGGGSSVQFTEIETLSSRPPLFEKSSKASVKTPSKTNNKKRRSDNEDDNENEESWSSVGTRCGVGIEGKPGSEPVTLNHPTLTKKFKMKL